MKLALINANTYKEGVNEIGDVVGRFSDDHTFTLKEHMNFDIIEVSDTKEDIQAIIPEVKPIFRAKTTEWTDERPEEKRVWVDPKDGLEKEVVNAPKYQLKYDTVTKEFSHNLSRDTDNLTPIAITKATVEEVELTK